MQVDLPLFAFFEEPTVLHLALVINELKAEGTTPPVIRIEGRSEYPLSHSQLVFWLLEQQNPETGLYNKPRVFRIHGRVDPEVMERSLNELRLRHEILRVQFVSGVNGPVQVVQANGGVPFVFTDLSALEPALCEPAAMKLALQTVRKPLDLERGEVQRAHLMRLADDEWLLCISEHHVVNDGFTGSILLDELGAIYDAFAAREPNPLPPPVLHYTDYAVWGRQWMQGPRLQAEMEYWRERLQDAPTTVQLPTDYAPAAEMDRRGGLRSRMISAERLRDLRAFASASGTTQFTVMAAGLRALLARWSGQSDFLLGTLASNRSRSGTERMPGPFVNPLPLRNAISEGQTVRDLVNREKQSVMEAFAHQDCPFAKIVEAVNPERSGNDNPLFNVGLLVENFPEIALKGRNFEAEYLNFDPEASLLDLRFVALEKQGALRLSCEYKSGLFAPETVDSLLRAYADILAEMAANPERQTAELTLPTELQSQVEASSLACRQTIAIAATYTAEPIQEPLEFWLKQLGVPQKIVFALFNQVFQQLLDPSSELATNQYGANVVLVRIEDLGTAGEAGLDAGIQEFLGALRTAVERTAAPLIMVVGPPSEAVRQNPAQAKAIETAELKLVVEARHFKNLQIVTSRELLRLFPVSDYADEYAYSVSHIPYKSAMFTAMASMIARCIYASRRAEAELIVLDGDSALGNDQLVQFALAQEEAGVILGLCIRESEAAVSTRFDGDSGPHLGWQNIAASRCGVRAKSQAVKEIGEELGLSLDGCIFVTGDPMEAAEVRANCPATLVAEIPAEPDAIPGFLKHFWGFDRGSSGTHAQPALRADSQLLHHIATRLDSVDAVAHAIDSSRVMQPQTSEGVAPPRSPDEEFLADVWATLLRLERPSIHDNFFALGGHSLMAVQVIARVRQTLGVELPLRAMFDAPTIAQLSERIETERRAQTGLVVPPMVRVSRAGDLPVSYAQQRLWFIDQLEPGSPLYNISAMYRMRGELNVPALERTINEIARRHESLRTTFRNVDGHPTAVISAELAITLTPIQVAGAAQSARERELERWAHDEAATPFDLAAGPLIRVRLLRLNEADHALLIVVHHIVGDGWSGSLIAGELAALYEAFAHDRPSPLIDLPIQYADFAQWQR
ncbi:MAG TPA: condensation domain-containing protein, partial [Candidatus Angelobacter sp.]|nr:condensation domain-containing protein [Candidatus Angelobacter sp.]